jgi:hypothetical protein
MKQFLIVVACLEDPGDISSFPKPPDAARVSSPFLEKSL